VSISSSCCSAPSLEDLKRLYSPTMGPSRISEVLHRSIEKTLLKSPRLWNEVYDADIAPGDNQRLYELDHRLRRRFFEAELQFQSENRWPDSPQERLRAALYSNYWEIIPSLAKRVILLEYNYMRECSLSPQALRVLLDEILAVQNIWLKFMKDQMLESVWVNNREIVEAFLDKGCPLNDKDSRVMHWASRVEVARLLIERGAKINLKNGAARTPLCQAVQSRNMRMVQLLIKHGVTNLTRSELDFALAPASPHSVVIDAEFRSVLKGGDKECL